MSALVLNILIRGALCFLFVFLPLSSLDQWFYDHSFRLRGRQLEKLVSSAPIVLVRINEAKLLDYFPGQKPESALKSTVWNTKFYEDLLSKIEEYEPKAVVMTNYYGSVDSKKPLEFKNVVLSARLNEENQLIGPPNRLTNESYGFNNLFPDSDNVLRRTRLAYSTSKSLAFRTLEILGENMTGRLSKLRRIDFRGPTRSYNRINAQDVLAGAVPMDEFNGKIVLVGREVAGSLQTPFGPMSRLEIHANILDTFLNDREISIVPSWVTYLISSLAVIGSAVIILALPLKHAWVSLLGLSLGLFLSSNLILTFFKVWPGVANPIMSVFGTHLLMFGLKLSQQEKSEWRIRQESKHLKEMDQFKNNFISLFSHDLKTPISKIQAIIRSVISKNSIDEETKESLSTIDEINDELARKISDILKVMKMEAMSLELGKEVIDINRVVAEEIDKLRFFSEKKKIEITFNPEPLFSIEADPVLIREVISNLVENAIKYSPEASSVEVHTKEVDNRIQVAIKDEGEGIPADEVPRVTGKFYRGKDASKITQGSGLGLYLAKYFVSLHGGGLELKSELGKGTEVSFWLPITSP